MEVASRNSFTTKVIAALVALAMTASFALVAPAQAIAATAKQPAAVTAQDATANQETLVANLTARFSKGGKSAALNNSTVDAAFALYYLDRASAIDVDAISSSLAEAEGSAYGVSAGALAKHAIIFQLAGATDKAKSCVEKMSTAYSQSEIDSGFFNYDASWILLAYHLTQTTPSSAALLDESGLVKMILDTQVSNGMFGGDYWSTQTTAQAIMALDGVSSASDAVAKGVEALLSAQMADGGFYYEAASMTESQIEATGDVALALLRYGIAHNNSAAAQAASKAGAFLAASADSTLDGYVSAATFSEPLTCATAFAGLAASQLASEAFDLTKAEIEGISANETYTGAAIEPVPAKVTLAGRELAAGTDYTLAYSDNVAAGTAKVTLTGAGNFTGTQEATFTIDKATISGAKVKKIANKKHTGKAIKPKPKVTFNGQVLKKGVDYKLSYSKNKKVGTAKIKITGKGNFEGSKTVKFKIVKVKKASKK